MALTARIGGSDSVQYFVGDRGISVTVSLTENDQPYDIEAAAGAGPTIRWGFESGNFMRQSITASSFASAAGTATFVIPADFFTRACRWQTQIQISGASGTFHRHSRPLIVDVGRSRVNVG